jgi:hypothetical protein
VTAKQRRLIISRALALLEQGVLLGVLPGLLLREFNLTPGQARELVGVALREHKAASGRSYRTGGLATNYKLRAKVIIRALELLEQGVAPGVLPNWLKDEYDLTPGQAQERAEVALMIFEDRQAGE